MHPACYSDRDLCYCLEGHFAFHDIQTLEQSRIVLAGLFPAFVCQRQRITQRGVRKGQSRGVRHCARNIGYAVVYNTIYGINRLAVGRRMRGLEATALVDGYVHHNCAGLHQFQHVFGNQMRGFGSRNQNCADHYVHCGQQLADVVVGRVECVYVGRGLNIQLTQARQ